MPLLLSPLIVSFVVLLWTTGAEPSVIAGWSGLALMYFLFFAPTDCVALEAGNTRCRTPTGGLLRSCDELEHKRLYVRRLLPVEGGGWWRARGSELVSSPKNIMSTVGASASLTSLLFAMIARVL